MFGKTDP